MLLGVGLGLMRPGSAAGASLSVEANEQGAAAGWSTAWPCSATSSVRCSERRCTRLSPIGPYVLNAAIMTAAWALLFASPRLRNLSQ